MNNQLQPTSGGGISRGTKDATNLLSRLRKTKMFDQLCLLVLDGSGSMLKELEDGFSRADVTAKAAAGLVHLLQKSTNSPSFSIGIICFADVVEVRLHTQYVDKLEISKINFVPFTSGGQGNRTYVHLGLQEAEKMGAAFLNNGDPNSTLKRSVRIILMSDGYANNPEGAIVSADQIREKWGDKMRINTSLIGSIEQKNYGVAEKLLISIASKDPNGKSFYSKSSSGAELRAFFVKSSTDE